MQDRDVHVDVASRHPQTDTAHPGLTRSLTLVHATLYGLGVTIGAGIYVLVGAAAASAGMSAPLAFLAAAFLMALSAASFAELASRLPVAAGEAAYVRTAFGLPVLTRAVGLLVVGIAIVSATAIAIGSAGYIAVFIALPLPLLVTIVVVAMGGIAAWGVRESVTFAGLMTVVEIGGLVLLVGAALMSDVPVIKRLPEIIPSTANPLSIAGLVSALLLAVFAFIGFEGLANIAEEVRSPSHTLPRAIFLTLAIATLLYVSVMWIALVTVGPLDLARSQAPLALVFERLTGTSPTSMSLIAVVATLNGIVVQIIMASRVLYGLASQADLPKVFAGVHHRTRTPLVATASVSGLILALALVAPLHALAEVTARLTLIVFAMVNVSLIAIKRRDPFRSVGYVAPFWMPWAGAATCILLLATDLWYLLRAWAA